MLEQIRQENQLGRECFQPELRFRRDAYSPSGNVNRKVAQDAE
jgi:hypothetical protein